MDLFLAAALAVLFYLLVPYLLPVRGSRYGRLPRHNAAVTASHNTRSVRCLPKPPWVARELVRLKALSPELGCRVIAEFFNRRFENSRGITVGKTFVATTLRKHKLDVLRLRRELKHRVPPPAALNRVWAIDLTGKSDLTGRQRMILGLIDHGARACLRLTELTNKSSLNILRELIASMRRFGAPRFIRTDNESCFTSLAMRGALRLLGVRMQRTAPHSPWMNGKIERFFGTLKSALDHITIADGAELAVRLAEFRCFYNHVRPHQHLGGRTPAEAWDQRAKSTRRPQFVNAWGGLLSGWHFQS